MKRNLAYRLLSTILLVVIIFLLPIQAKAAEATLEGIKFSDASVSKTTVTMSASRSKWASSATTKTVTVTNNNANTVKLTFNYEAKTAGGTGDKGSATRSAPTNGTVESDEGNKCVMTLKSGGYFTVTIVADDDYGRLGSSTYYYIMTNVDVEPIYDATNLTVNYESSLGTVTYNSSTVVAGSTITGIAADEVVTATPATGVQFIGWIDTTGKVLSKTTTYKVAPTAATMTVKAVFATTSPWFYVNNNDYLVEGLDVADDYSGTIVLANNATLPSGNYTIKSGATLLIPYDSGFTCSVETPEVVIPSAHVAPSAYRTLTMAEGANITVNGTMTVPSKVRAGDSTLGYAGTMPSGKYGHVVMNSGSTITVKNGAKLSAYGYITGSGSIVAESGAAVYEAFQVMAFRGGTATATMSTDKKTFPISQYYVQNIEVPLTIYSGAEEIAYTALYMSDTVIDSQVAYIGQSGCLFNLTSGYMVKQYDRANDRQQIDFYGDMTISKFAINIKFIIEYNINSEDYVLPITNNMTVDIHNGATISVGANMSLLPGAEIDIHEGGKLVLASGKSMYLYDLDQWKGKEYIYSAGTKLDIAPVTYVPNRVKTRTSADLKDAEIIVDGTLDASAGKLYTSVESADNPVGGAAIKGAEGGQVILTLASDTADKQARQLDDVEYDDITMKSAWLQHGDGTYLVSDKNDTYTYTNGRWVCGTHTAGDAATCTTAQTCTVCGAELAPATGHTNADPVTENNVDATCDADGSYESVVYCSVCKAEISRETVTVTATGHHYTQVVTPPTCEAGGYTTYTCTCGESYTGNETDALGHDYEITESVAATCTEDGHITYTCKNDPTHTYTETLSHAGHSYEEVVTAPTCTAEGYTTYTCVACGDSYIDNYTEKLPHQYVDNTCTGCGEVIGTITKGRFTMELDGVVYLNYYPTLKDFSAGFDFANRGGVLVLDTSTLGEGENPKKEMFYVGSPNCQVIEGMDYRLDEDGNQMWFVQSPEIVAKELGRDVYLRPYIEAGVDADGKPVYVYMDVVQYYSPAKYCCDILKNPDAENDDTENLCAALLQYGMAAEAYFTTTATPVSTVLSKYTQVDLSSYDEKLAYDPGYLDALNDASEQAKALYSQVKTAALKYTDADGAESYAVAMDQTLNLGGAIKFSVGVSLLTNDKGLTWDKIDLSKSKVQFWTESDLQTATSLDHGAKCTHTSGLTLEDPNATISLGKYRASSQYIVAKNLGEPVYYICYLVTTDGTVYRSGLQYSSPEKFLAAHLNGDTTSENEKLMAVCQRLAVYGEMARVRFTGSTAASE